MNQSIQIGYISDFDPIKFHAKQQTQMHYKLLIKKRLPSIIFCTILNLK